MQQHAPLAMRVVHYVHLEAFDREVSALIDHAFKAAGATQSGDNPPNRYRASL
jgi:hypothetical protein